jgi:hypothetical protein
VCKKRSVSEECVCERREKVRVKKREKKGKQKCEWRERGLEKESKVGRERVRRGEKEKRRGVKKSVEKKCEWRVSEWVREEKREKKGKKKKGWKGMKGVSEKGLG